MASLGEMRITIRFDRDYLRLVAYKVVLEEIAKSSPEYARSAESEMAEDVLRAMDDWDPDKSEDT